MKIIADIVSLFNRLGYIGLIILNVSCSPDQNTTSPLPYSTKGGQLLKNEEAVQLKGVNSLQTYGLTDASLMNEWQIEISREFIGNLREQPISGGAQQGSDGVWYHPLQQIVNQNRANNRVTILCPFGWVNSAGERLLLTGLNPSDQNFYADYKIKMRALAEQFKNQPDVWIEVWNEPYHWNNQNNYSAALWLNDMRDMVENLRQVNGFENIIVVPGNEQGQSETVLLTHGKDLMAGENNIVFDLHAYEKWLVDQTEEEIINRLQHIQNSGIPFIIGEIGVQNVGDIMPVQAFLNAAKSTGLTTLAWLWNQNSEDNNALLTNEGLANAQASNNFWGEVYRAFLED